MMRLLLVCLFSLCVAGCNGLNTDCQWPADGSQALDLENLADQQHLRRDVEVAEELAIRYGDVRWSPGPARRQGRDRECLTPLFGEIAHRHGVTVDDVRRVRERLTDRGLNLAANVPIGVFYGLVTLFAIRRVHTRFSYQEERLAVVVATVLTSVMVAGVTVGFGRMWEGAVEIVRVGNDHLSYRGLRLVWTQHAGQLFVLGIVLFWMISLAHYRIVQARHSRPKISGYSV